MELFIEPYDDPEILAEFIAAIETLAYGLFILRANVNDRIRRFATVIRRSIP